MEQSLNITQAVYVRRMPEIGQSVGDAYAIMVTIDGQELSVPVNLGYLRTCCNRNNMYQLTHYLVDERFDNNVCKPEADPNKTDVQKVWLCCLFLIGHL